MGSVTTKSGRKHLAFALDYSEVGAASMAVEQVAPYVGVLKIGLEMFVREGPSALRLGAHLGCETFLDLKLHDIPETVERAVANACQLGVRYLTVHASGGPRMLAQAVERVAKEGSELTILAVTVLTSLDSSDLQAMGVQNSPAEQVLALARLAHSVGVNGFVCAASEVSRLRAELGPSAALVTPGIRPAGLAANDQKRVETPESAIRAGSSLLVVGRPIRDAADPRAAAEKIEREIARALEG
jgi:orotidine-5'-phosphate decarboxylase